MKDRIGLLLALPSSYSPETLRDECVWIYKLTLQTHLENDYNLKVVVLMIKTPSGLKKILLGCREEK